MTAVAITSNTMTAAEARTAIDAIKSTVERLGEMITDVYTRQAWRALGYQSWNDCCRAEFAMLRVPGDQLAEVIAPMREAGMSVRAIASATGAGKSTVARTLPGVPDGTPAGQVLGTDGKTYTRPKTAAVWPEDVEPVIEPDEVIEPATLDDEVGPCGPDTSFNPALKAAGSFLRNLTDNPTPEQAGKVRRLLTRHLSKLEKIAPIEPTPPNIEATLALINDLRGPWSKGLVRATRNMTPKARGHVIDALQTTLDQIDEQAAA